MIVDAHCHILPESFPHRHEELAARDATYAALFPQPGGRMATAQDLLAAMGQAGVDRSVVMGFGWTSPDVAREANDYIIQAVAESPERLTGFCSVNPAWGEQALVEVERCARAGLQGIGELHPDTQAFDLADRDRLAPLMELARAWGLPILIHCSEPVGHQYAGKGKTTPDKVWRFIESFPDNTIICAHWGGGLPFYALMPEVAAALGNVYFDTAASPYLYRPGVYPAAASLVGAGRILFASDYPLLRPSRPLSELAGQPLPECQRRRILGENAAQLLGL